MPYARTVIASLSLAVLLGLAPMSAPADETACPPRPRTVEDLRKLSACQLWELWQRADVGNIPCGDLDGRLLVLCDGGLPRLKVWGWNSVWRGKYLGDDGCTINRWIGNRRWLGTHYVVGPSCVDGRPAIVVEYPRGTPIFANMRDEIREVAPGLYLGAVFVREPCGRHRGFFAVEIPCAAKCCGR